MPLLKKRPEPERSTTGEMPELTHQSSAESVGSPITPSHDVSVHPSNTDIKVIAVGSDATHDDTIATAKSPSTDNYPFPTATRKDTTSDFPLGEPPKIVPSKDLAFLKEDPFADDDIIPFDKNKAIIPSRKGSVRSIMSTSSVQSIKRGLGSIKRSISRRRSERRARKLEPKVERAPTMVIGPDGITPVVRTHTYMMGPTFSAPRRVETYQVSAMAF